MIKPKSLKQGDKIAIISPSSPVKEEYIDGAVAFLRSEGFEPVTMPAAKGPASGSYAAREEDRLRDITDAWKDPSIRAVLCSRGGYGAVHLLEKIDLNLLRRDPKWLIGFSDISALHALSLRAGVMSLHSPMAKHLTLMPKDDPCTRRLLNYLRGDEIEEISFAPTLFDRPGEGEGILVGGNLAVLNGLFGTPYDILACGREDEGLILFIEDISEAIYAVERMLYHIRLSGGFKKVKGLIVGQFTDYRPDRNFSTMEEMISDFLDREEICGFPVAFNFPVGHVDTNYPLACGSRVRLRVTSAAVTLTTIYIRR